MTDIYEAPKAKLEHESESADSLGSIEEGLRGNYRFEIFEVISEAWEKTSGAKGAIWLAILIYFAISIGLSIVSQIFLAIVATMAANNEAVVIFFSFVLQVIFNAILFPVAVGLFILGIRRSAMASLQPGSILGFFSSMIPLFVTYILMSLMILVGLLLLVLPGIYLMVAYYFAMPLVVEKGLSPWQAMEVSRKVISKRWFTMFFFMIVFLLIIVGSMLVIIGWIWAIPLALIAYGIVYRNMFGIRDETLAEA